MVLTILSGCYSQIGVPDVGFSAHQFVKEDAEEALKLNLLPFVKLLFLFEILNAATSWPITARVPWPDRPNLLTRLSRSTSKA